MTPKAWVFRDVYSVPKAFSRVSFLAGPNHVSQHCVISNISASFINPSSTSLASLIKSYPVYSQLSILPNVLYADLCKLSFTFPSLPHPFPKILVASAVTKIMISVSSTPPLWSWALTAVMQKVPLTRYSSQLWGWSQLSPLSQEAQSYAACYPNSDSSCVYLVQFYSFQCEEDCLSN